MVIKMFGKKYNKTIKVEGLTCPNCAKKVENELLEINDVKKVNVDLQSGMITITSKSEINNDEIEKRLEGKDFKVLYIK